MRRALGFTLESGQPFGITCQRVGQDFDRDVAMQFGVRAR